MLVIALLATSCRSQATVEMNDSAAGNDQGTEPTDTDAPTQEDTAQDDPTQEDPTQDDPAQDDTAPTDEARFVVRGELPLASSEVDALLAFIEEQTGRPFRRPPVIVAQSGDDFIDGLQDDMEDFEADAETSVRQLQALGLTDRGVGEVAAAFEALLLSPEGILGYYDPDTDELYVPVGAEADDEFRSLVVHELTHALDGQYSDLSRLDQLVDEAEVTGEYEPVGALQAVAEGRASAVQNAWEDANEFTRDTPDDLGAAADVPPALLLSLSIPYVFGEQWVLLNGGPSGTWDALDEPPPSSEVYLIPGTPDSEPIVDVPTPATDGPVLDEFDFGAVDILVWLLGESLEPDPATIVPTLTAIDGWAGGRAVLWGDDDESCLRIVIAADTDADLGELETAFELWADRGQSADRSVSLDNDRVTVTGCAPFVP